MLPESLPPAHGSKLIANRYMGLGLIGVLAFSGVSFVLPDYMTTICYLLGMGSAVIYFYGVFKGP